MAADVHYLYVKVVSRNDDDPASKDITLKVLKFIHGNLNMLRSMGVVVVVNRVRSVDLQNALCVESMRKKGITRLPALVTPNNIFIGLQNIVDVYEKNIAAFTRPAPAPERRASTSVEDFYRSEMTMAKAAKDTEDDTIGEGDNMMKSYQSMMTKRENPTARKRAAPAMHEREDNVAMDDDDEISQSIGKLGRDVDNDLLNKAFSSHTNEDGDNGFQDDFMLQAYLANNGLDD